MPFVRATRREARCNGGESWGVMAVSNGARWCRRGRATGHVPSGGDGDGRVALELGDEAGHPAQRARHLGEPVYAGDGRLADADGHLVPAVPPPRGADRERYRDRWCVGCGRCERRWRWWWQWRRGDRGAGKACGRRGCGGTRARRGCLLDSAACPCPVEGAECGEGLTVLLGGPAQAPLEGAALLVVPHRRPARPAATAVVGVAAHAPVPHAPHLARAGK